MVICSKVEGNEGLRARLTADRGRGEGGLHLDEFVWVEHLPSGFSEDGGETFDLVVFADAEAKGMVRGAR